MKKRFVRVIAALTVLATAGLSLELIPGAVQIAGAASGSTSISVGCSGLTDDNAGTVSGAQKTSAGLIALLATLGGPPNLALPVTVNATLPDKVKKGSGPFDAGFQFVISLPASLATQAKTTLGVSSLQIVNASFGVTYDGAETGSLPPTAIASQTIDLNGSASTSVNVAGPVPSDASGHLNFRPAPFTLGIAVNGSVAGIATIGTITITCSSGAAIGSTSIQVPGAPDTPGSITAGPIVGGDTSLIPIQTRSDITPDDGNPIDWSTLSVVNGSYGAKVGGGFLAQPTPAAGGMITSTLQVCAPSRPVPAVPGTDQVQSLMWPTPMYGSSGPHPSFMTLTFGGKETAQIPLSSAYALGSGVDGVLGVFVAPSPATIQNALAALPTIGAGNVKVTSIKGGYDIEFVGAKADTPEPMIGIGQWNTVPFASSGYAQIQAAIAGLTAPAAPPAPGVTTTTNPGATTMTTDQLNAELIAGTISLATWQLQFPAAFVNSITGSATKNIDSILATLKQIYPQPPDASGLPAQGVLTIPATETGPLCSQFDVQVPSVSLAFLALVDRLLHPVKASVLSCTLTRVRVKVRVHGRLVTRLVTKKVCKTMKVVKKK